jgi:rhamnose transport system permease protein
MAERRPLPVEGVLALLLLAEVALFSLTGAQFASAANLAELLRTAAAIGLIAVAMTPVVMTGGIDLSVGALVGLAGIAMGQLWRDAGVPIGVAAVLTVAGGALAGLLNGWLVAGLRLPALIVTLGTLSLFRGLAEALTGGTDTITGFPAAFLAIGQGELFGMPWPAVPFALVAAAVALAVHRGRIGRAWTAIGFAGDGARHAGIAVGRSTALAYVLCGAAAALAAVIATAHVGQAKADAGLGWELQAITAIVLGGTAITGGSGSIAGTLLGLAVVVVLRNGLQLSDGPAELAGILTGVLLVAAIALRPLLARLTTKASA